MMLQLNRVRLSRAAAPPGRPAAQPSRVSFASYSRFSVAVRGSKRDAEKVRERWPESCALRGRTLRTHKIFVATSPQHEHEHEDGAKPRRCGRLKLLGPCLRRLLGP
jgi:hypothetical protein